ncbi:MAG: polyphosphate kinase [Oleiphilaceae bacterium]|nr:polyphosphate kinase [Oleiphilaceae bacterium]
MKARKEQPPGSRFCYQLDKPRLADYPTRSTETLKPLQPTLELIGEYQRRLWANRRHSVLLLVHGIDASGKDSLIRTLATHMDPAGFHAWSFGRPLGEEARHDFLWRVVPKLPAHGEVSAFNRSYHEATIAERVWPVHEPERYDWQARYDAIRAFEKHLLSEGTSLIKLWLNLSDSEHKKRLIKRLDKPRKRWKFDKSDIEAWYRRKEYMDFAEQSMAATHTDKAPWHIIPGDNKPAARAIVAELLAEHLQRLAPDYPSERPEVLDQYRKLLNDAD